MKQPRDSKGRFLSWDGTHNKKYSIKDLEKVFYDGMGQNVSFMSPSKRWELYKKQRGLKE